MPYRCAFGCTSFDPSCDACDSACSSDDYIRPEQDEKLKRKAAQIGLTKEEFLEKEETDENSS